MSKLSANRPYHHGDLRQSLIDAACKHLLESGADTLSLRALAREVGVSQTAPYRHFESKAALFRAIAIYGFEILITECEAAERSAEGDVEETIVAVGLAYVDFARRNPEKYQLFFDSSLVDFNKSPALAEAGDKAFSVMTRMIEKGITAGILVDRPVLEVAGALWASMHGAASLLLSKAPVLSALERKSQAMIVMQNISDDPRPTIELFLNSIRKPC